MKNIPFGFLQHFWQQLSNFQGLIANFVNKRGTSDETSVKKKKKALVAEQHENVWFRRWVEYIFNHFSCIFSENKTCRGSNLLRIISLLAIKRRDRSSFSFLCRTIRRDNIFRDRKVVAFVNEPLILCQPLESDSFTVKIVTFLKIVNRFSQIFSKTTPFKHRLVVYRN